MNAVSMGNAAGIVGGAPIASGAPPAAIASSLLPVPLAGPMTIEALYAVMAETNAAEADVGEARVEHASVQQKLAIQEERDARARAEEAAKGGFLSFLGPLGKLLMAAAAAVTVVCTGGAGLGAVVGVGLAMSAGAFVVGETKCLDGIFGKGASSWFAAGLGLAATAMTFGAGAGTSTSALADGLSAASQVATGAHGIDNAVHRYTADLAMIDAKEAQHHIERMQDVIEQVITLLEENKDASRRNSAMVNEIVNKRDTTLLVAAGGRA